MEPERARHEYVFSRRVGMLSKSQELYRVKILEGSELVDMPDCCACIMLVA